MPGPVATVEVAPAASTVEVTRTVQLVATAKDAGGFVVPDQPVTTITTNVRGTEIILDLCHRHGVKLFVASTSEIYGKGGEKLDEDHDRVVEAEGGCIAWGGAVRLSGLQPRVETMISMTGVHKIVPLHRAEEEALAAARGPALERVTVVGLGVDVPRRLSRDAGLTDLIESREITGATEATPANDLPDRGNVYAVVDVLDEAHDVVDRGAGQDAVPEVEDVPRPARDAVENVRRARPEVVNFLGAGPAQ